MPRQPRLDAPGTLHHVIGRGIEGSKIFETPGARKVFSQIAVKRLGYSGAAVGRFWGVTTPLVNWYASSEEVGNIYNLRLHLRPPFSQDAQKANLTKQSSRSLLAPADFGRSEQVIG